MLTAVAASQGPTVASDDCPFDDWSGRWDAGVPSEPEALEVRPGTPVLLTLPVGVTAAGIWYYGALRRLGANVVSVGAYATERKAELLARFRAEVLIGTPSYLERLTHVCEQLGTPPASLLRFATGDRVQFVAAGSCPCGRPLPGIRAGGVYRYDDMIKVRGVNVWPRSLDQTVFGVAGVHDYRGVIATDARAREVVELRVEVDSAAPADDVVRAIAAGVRRQVGLSVHVETIAPGRIAAETPEGFVKVARWRDLRRSRREDLDRNRPTTQEENA
jgi:phenylacetate-coenzyme A ligase PaaK-like adenylate-forming protein